MFLEKLYSLNHLLLRLISTLLKPEIFNPSKAWEALEGLKFQDLEGLKFQNKQTQKQMTQTNVIGQVKIEPINSTRILLTYVKPADFGKHFLTRNQKYQNSEEIVKMPSVLSVRIL